jgi:hypothetical protein
VYVGEQEEKFKVVNATLSCFQALAQYQSCAEKIPAIATEVGVMLGKLLKVFNSKSALLILGAEAMHGAAGLKAISTKHLALCSESIGAVLALMPPVAARLGIADGYAEIVGEYTHHKKDLFGKMVTIMDQMSAYELAQYLEGPRDVLVNFSNIADKTHTLYRVLVKVLSLSSLEELFGTIFEMYAEKMSGLDDKAEELLRERFQTLPGGSKFVLRKREEKRPPPPDAAPAREEVDNDEADYLE